MIKPDFTIDKYAETQPYSDPNKLEQVTNMLLKAGLPCNPAKCYPKNIRFRFNG